MAEFFAELKRRHMYRVAAAYAVVAWLLLQLINNVAPILDLPVWVARALLLALVLGFPIALLFVWMRELAPADGATPRAATTKLDYVLAGALVVVIALVSYQQLVTAPGASTAEEQASVTSALPQPQPRGIAIAVLPFANMSGDASQEFFSDGITEEINAALTKVPDLRVVARTSAFEFKGQNRNVRMVGESLGATHLIEGSVRKAGNRVRIAAQLVQADNGLNVWSESYDRELTDIFSIQEDIAKAIAMSLRVPLGLQQGQALVTSRTTDEAAYDNYLRAKTLVRARAGGVDLAPDTVELAGRRGLLRLTEAAQLLEGVVARDPNFAPAFALLAYANALMPIFNPAFVSGASEQVSPVVESLIPKAEGAARRAIQLDPKNADGYIALGYVLYSRGRFDAANNYFNQGLTLDPNNPDGLHFYSGMLADLGYLKQAILMRERLRELEPLANIFRAVTSRFLLANGRPDAALSILTTPSQLIRAQIYAAQGKYAQAADALMATPAGTYLPGSAETAARILRTAPAPAAAPSALPRLGGFGYVYLYVGAPDRVLEWHEDNLKIGLLGGAMNAMLWAPPYAPVRKTERFKTFVRAAGFVDYWRARGWPDLCRPMGTDDFVCD